MKIAKLIKNVSANYVGNAGLYNLNPALEHEVYDYDLDGYVPELLDYVIISYSPLVDKVVAFPADESSQLSWSDCAVIKNESNHSTLLESMGYILEDTND